MENEEWLHEESIPNTYNLLPSNQYLVPSTQYLPSTNHTKYIQYVVRYCLFIQNVLPLKLCKWLVQQNRSLENHLFGEVLNLVF